MGKHCRHICGRGRSAAKAKSVDLAAPRPAEEQVSVESVEVATSAVASAPEASVEAVEAALADEAEDEAPTEVTGEPQASTPGKKRKRKSDKKKKGKARLAESMSAEDAEMLAALRSGQQEYHVDLSEAGPNGQGFFHLEDLHDGNFGETCDVCQAGPAPGQFPQEGSKRST